MQMIELAILANYLAKAVCIAIGTSTAAGLFIVVMFGDRERDSA
jgi:hypothetical protein